MHEIKELNNLPEELRLWGEQALDKIEAPEKRHEAACDLKDKMEHLWNECSMENPEEKTAYVLSRLGDAQAVAVEMKKTYAWKATPRTDIKVGIILLILSVLCGVYAYMAFFVFPNHASNEASIYATYLTGRGAGGGAVCAIVFMVLGIMILLNARKGER